MGLTELEFFVVIQRIHSSVTSIDEDGWIPMEKFQQVYPENSVNQLLNYPLK